jgi:hypothetical protein
MQAIYSDSSFYASRNIIIHVHIKEEVRDGGFIHASRAEVSGHVWYLYKHE